MTCVKGLQCDIASDSWLRVGGGGRGAGACQSNCAYCHGVL